MNKDIATKQLMNALFETIVSRPLNGVDLPAFQFGKSRAAGIRTQMRTIL
jgi:hypothetical protein